MVVGCELRAWLTGPTTVIGDSLLAIRYLEREIRNSFSTAFPE
jgi:hypothetical protein